MGSETALKDGSTNYSGNGRIKGDSMNKHMLQTKRCENIAQGSHRVRHIQSMVRTGNSKKDCVEGCKTFQCCNEEFMIYPNNTREPLKQFKQSSDEILCIASNILMAEERKNQEGGYTSGLRNTFSYVSFIQFLNIWSLSPKLLRIYTSLSAKYTHFCTHKLSVAHSH